MTPGAPRPDSGPALGQVAGALNAAGVCWALGGSLLLAHYGLADTPRDIDLLVAEADADRAEAALAALGPRTPWVPTAPYETRRFLEFRVAGAEVDLMAGLAIRHDGGLYRHPFDAASPEGSLTLGGCPIPLMALEDWFVLYQLIPGREAKAARIEAFLRNRGLGRRDLLTRALAQPLPEAVRQRCTRLLTPSHLQEEPR